MLSATKSLVPLIKSLVPASANGGHPTGRELNRIQPRVRELEVVRRIGVGSFWDLKLRADSRQPARILGELLDGRQ